MSVVVRDASKISVRDPLYAEVLEFLEEEAELLNDNRFTDWFELLADDITYIMPVRATVDPENGDGFSSNMFWFNDDRASLNVRLLHIQSKSNWAEGLPTRTRRFVTNIRVECEGELLRARSSLLLVRSRWDNRNLELLSAKRIDTLKRVGDAYKLARREVYLDQTNFESPNLAVFL